MTRLYNNIMVFHGFDEVLKVFQCLMSGSHIIHYIIYFNELKLGIISRRKLIDLFSLIYFIIFYETDHRIDEVGT